MKFNESSLPEMYSQVLLSKEEPLEIHSSIAHKVYEVMISSMSDFLSLVKNKAKTAISINQLNGDLILAGVVTYHENEDDKDMPGNYTYEFTTDKNDLEGAVVYQLDDSRFIQITSAKASNDYNFSFRKDSYIYSLYSTAATTLIEWLDSNASEKEEVTLELPGYFMATVAVEDKEKVMSIIPDGAMKRLIKDDASIEK